MGRKKSPTSDMDIGEKARTPLAQRLFSVITDPVTLAGKLGVSPQAVSQYRNGGAQPTLERLCQIADIYGVSVDYLLGRTDIPSSNPDVRSACDFTGLSAGAVNWLHNNSNDDNKFKVSVLNALFDSGDSRLADLLLFAMYDYATSHFSKVIIKDDVMKSDRVIEHGETRSMLKFYAQDTFSIVLDFLYEHYATLNYSVAEAKIKEMEYRIDMLNGGENNGKQ